MLNCLRPHCRTPCRSFMLALLLWPAWLSVTSAAGPEQAVGLDIAVAPFLPARILVENYQPMRMYLEQHLQQPVLIVTAPDYKTFYERTKRHEYPVIITVANAAYLAYTESGYVPMLRPLIYTRPILVVRTDSHVTRLQNLHGKTVALPDSLAIIAMQGVQMLHKAGLDPDKDVHLKYMSNHSTAVNHVIDREVDAAIISDRALLQMPATARSAVRVIDTWEQGAVPGVLYLANPALSPPHVAQITQVILEFVHETAEGRAFIKKLGYGDLVPATARDMESLAPYGELFKATIANLGVK